MLNIFLHFLEIDILKIWWEFSQQLLVQANSHINQFKKKSYRLHSICCSEKIFQLISSWLFSESSQRNLPLFFFWLPSIPLYGCTKLWSYFPVDRHIVSPLPYCSDRIVNNIHRFLSFFLQEARPVLPTILIVKSLGWVTGVLSGHWRWQFWLGSAWYALIRPRRVSQT